MDRVDSVITESQQLRSSDPQSLQIGNNTTESAESIQNVNKSEPDDSPSTSSSRLSSNFGNESTIPNLSENAGKSLSGNDKPNVKNESHTPPKVVPVDNLIGYIDKADQQHYPTSYGVGNKGGRLLFVAQ